MTSTLQRSTSFDDPVALDIVWRRVVTVADEMQTVLRRTAFTTIVSAVNDLGCQILDARGWSVAHASTSMPMFNLALANVVQKLLVPFPLDSLAPGDVLFTNDPWLSTGHLNDVAVVTPFFKKGRVAGFAGTICHIGDVGGLLNSQMARSIFEEGIFVPPVRLYDRGRRNETLLALIRANVRTPDMVLGDLTAMVTANNVAVRQMLALLDEYGLDDLVPLSDAVQTRAERAMRQAIGGIADGDYPHEFTLDELDGPMTIGAVVRIRGSELELDYVKVPPEHPHGGINCTLTYTTGHSHLALNALLTPHIPHNAGLSRPLKLRAPEGSILNARYPAAVNDRMKVGWHVHAAVTGCLAKAIPHKVPAPAGFPSYFRVVGVDDYGLHFSELMTNGGGMGAGPLADGVDSICYPTSACALPVEIFENSTAGLTHERELLPDSAGPGRHRGGFGLRATVGVPDDRAQPLMLTPFCQHQGYPPIGLAGGRPATPTRVYRDGVELPTHEVRRQLGELAVSDPDLRLTMDTPGGGGYGNPAERDVEQVIADVRNGLVSVEAAARDYGVLIDLDTLQARRVVSNE
ncbi:MAG: hydantoinase B/oxoprolinase family protein [Chloroflexi bacterium]|nr:hydantoinase B/oxoprolinase family protein [Chloroflexota bacterium]